MGPVENRVHPLRLRERAGGRHPERTREGPDHGIQYRSQARLADGDVTRPGEIPQDPGPPYQQEQAYAMKATNYLDFSQRI